MKKKYKISTRTVYGVNKVLIPSVGYYTGGSMVSGMSSSNHSYKRVYGLSLEFLHKIFIIELEVRKYNNDMYKGKRENRAIFGYRVVNKK